MKMKKLAIAIVILISGTAIAQEKPKEVKEEAEVKTIKYKDADGVTEKKVKVIKREESEVTLEADDAKKVNQSRVSSDKIVEETVMVDDDGDDAFETLKQETYFVSSNGNYKFSPKKSGFTIVSKQNTDTSANAWETSNGYYLVRGEAIPNGVGHFNTDGNFIVEYYCTDSQCIKTITYNKDQ